MFSYIGKCKVIIDLAYDIGNRFGQIQYSGRYLALFIYEDRQIDRERERQGYRQIDKIDREIDRQRERERDSKGESKIQKNIQADILP